MFARLGTWCHDHRRAVIGIWLAVLIFGGIIGGAVGTVSKSQFELPNVESRRGTDILKANFGGAGAGFNGSVVFKAPQGVTDPTVQSTMSTFFTKIAAIKGLTVVSPYTPAGARQIAQTGADKGKIAYATIELPSDTTQEQATKWKDQIDKVQPTAKALPGVEIDLGGQIFGEFKAPSSELLGLAFAIVILILAFGSVLAMGLPVGTALFGIGVGTIFAGLLSHVVSQPDFAKILGVMIGLGVGIDYALFIVTRFRENMHSGHDVRESTVIALDTAGRAVLFAGSTVVISLLGMIVMQMSFVTGLAVGTATVVLTTMVASLTLLPALLGFAGERVEVTRWRGLIAAGLVAIALVGIGLKVAPLIVGLPLALIVILAGFAYAPLRKQVPRRAPRPLEETAAYRWSRGIQHHPWRAFLTGVVVLLFLAIPLLGMHLGFPDEGNAPKDTQTRKAYDLLADGFGPGFNGPLLLTTTLPSGSTPADIAKVTSALAKMAANREIAISPKAVPNKPSEPTAVLWQVVPNTSPQDVATNKLVSHLRNDVLPQATQGTKLAVAVTGSVAVQVDFSSYLAQRLFVFLGAVLTLSFLLLMVVFRSILVPLKAVVMNLLSIGAAYGVIVALFQWGWARSILHVESAPIEPFMPMMLFAIVFGLSMDYEVFLLSRVREDWLRTGDSHTSVANGLAATARVITAAAGIMVFVFGSFLLDNNRTIKLFGTGLATAVLLDATIVRMLLVPATMELLGDKNWWLPKWLDKLLPNIDVEGHHDDLPSGEPGERVLEQV